MQDTLVIIPTYNEKENIEKIIRTTFSQKKAFDILVVDDNSPDGTALIVENLRHEFPKSLYIENRKVKNGLGAAYIHGFKWALARKYEFIIEMDADFSHNPADLEHLYEACAHDGADLSIGSRYSRGVNVVNWPMSRILLSFFASKYVRFVTGLPVHDTTAGFVCYKRKVLETINIDKIQFVGYAFQIEMKFKAWKHGFTIKEVSVIFTDRSLGESKMNRTIITEAIFGIIEMRLRGLPN
jgi:dolichol-phosphate mannosyltransferase